jgi:hypothetical protein
MTARQINKLHGVLMASCLIFLYSNKEACIPFRAGPQLIVGIGYWLPYGVFINEVSCTL